MVYSSLELSLNMSISLSLRVYLGQVMLDNRLVVVEPLGWLGSRWLMNLTGVILMSGQNHEGKEGSRYTESICAKVVTGETVHPRNITAVKGAEVRKALPALPH